MLDVGSLILWFVASGISRPKSHRNAKCGIETPFWAAPLFVQLWRSRSSRDLEWSVPRGAWHLLVERTNLRWSGSHTLLPTRRNGGSCRQTTVRPNPAKRAQTISLPKTRATRATARSISPTAEVDDPM